MVAFFLRPITAACIQIRKRIIAGFFVFLPIGITFWVLWFLFSVVDSLLGPFLKGTIHYYIPGFGFIAVFAILYLVGLFVTNIIGKALFHYFERVMLSTPVIKTVYYALKQITETVAVPAQSSFKEVVFIEYPYPGVRVIGFMTGITEDKKRNSKWVHVFVPTSPTPTSGFLEMVPEEKVYHTDWSIEEGLRLVVSCGTVSPEKRQTGFIK